MGSVHQGLPHDAGFGSRGLGNGRDGDRRPIGSAVHHGNGLGPIGVVVLYSVGAQAQERRLVIHFLQAHFVSFAIVVATLAWQLGILLGRA